MTVPVPENWATTEPSLAEISAELGRAVKVMKVMYGLEAKRYPARKAEFMYRLMLLQCAAKRLANDELANLRPPTSEPADVQTNAATEPPDGATATTHPSDSPRKGVIPRKRPQ